MRQYSCCLSSLFWIMYFLFHSSLLSVSYLIQIYYFEIVLLCFSSIFFSKSLSLVKINFIKLSLSFDWSLLSMLHFDFKIFPSFWIFCSSWVKIHLFLASQRQLNPFLQSCLLFFLYVKYFCWTFWINSFVLCKLRHASPKRQNPYAL